MMPRRSFAILAILSSWLLCNLAAQETTPEPTKKEETKSDKAPATEPKAEKKAAPKEENFKKNPQLVGVVRNVMERTITLSVQAPDAEKLAAYARWRQQEMVNVQKAPNAKEYASRLSQFQQNDARKQTELTSPKDLEIRAADAAIFRSLFPPVEYNSKGMMIVRSTKELKDLRGATTLPGYAVGIDAIVPQQTLQVYLKKTKSVPADPKGPPPEPPVGRKKKKDEVDDTPEAVMIVITREAPR